MPDSSPRSRRWFVVLGAMATLAVVVVVLGGFGLQLRSELNEAERRLSRVEINEVAEDAAERTAEVATCFARARARPDLVAVLTAIASLIETDPLGRMALDSFIENYDDSAPKLVECKQLARENRLDPNDFLERDSDR